MGAQEHAALDGAGELGVLGVHDLHLLRGDLHQGDFLVFIALQALCGKAHVVDVDHAFAGPHLGVEEVALPGLLHDVDGVRGDADAHGLAHGGVVRGMDHPLVAAAVHVDLIVDAHEHHGHHLAGDPGLLGVHDVDILGADDHIHLHVLAEARVHAGEGHALHAHLVVLQHDPGDDVALADKVRHKGVVGFVVDVGGLADLLDDPVLHDHDGVGHGQGLLLVVGHVDEGDAQLLLHALEFHLHLLAKLKVQGAQRLVQKQHLGLVHQGPGDGHPLLLAAGKLIDPALAVALQVHELQHGFHLPLDLGLGGLLDAQTEGDVVEHIEVGEQSVLLEHGVDLPLIGRDLGDVRAVHQDLARGGHDEARDEPEHGGLAAAGGAQQGQKLTVVDVQVHMVQRQIPVVILGNVPKLDQPFSHLRSSKLSIYTESAACLLLKKRVACSPRGPSSLFFRCWSSSVPRWGGNRRRPPAGPCAFAPRRPT